MFDILGGNIHWQVLKNKGTACWERGAQDHSMGDASQQFRNLQESFRSHSGVTQLW